MADSGTTRPAHRNVTGFGEFQQALELGIPGDREPGAGKGNPRAVAGWPGWRVRLPVRPLVHARRDGWARTENLRMNVVTGHAPTGKPGGEVL